MYEIISKQIDKIKDQILNAYAVMYLDPSEFHDFKNEDWSLSDILAFAGSIAEDYEVNHEK